MPLVASIFLFEINNIVKKEIELTESFDVFFMSRNKKIYDRIYFLGSSHICFDLKLRTVVIRYSVVCLLF